MTSFDRLAANGNVRYLTLHLMAQRTEERNRILVAGEHYTVAQPIRHLAGSRYPGPAGGLRRGPGRLRSQQRVRHLGAGQAAGLRAGNRVAAHRAGRTPGRSGGTTPLWGYRNTGGLTIPLPENITGRGWLESGW